MVYIYDIWIFRDIWGGANSLLNFGFYFVNNLNSNLLGKNGALGNFIYI